MSVPLAPPIDLSPIADLRIKPRAPKMVRRVASLAVLAGAGSGTAVLARRWIPPLVAIMHGARPKRRSFAPWVIAAGAGLLAAGITRWQFQRLFAPQPAHTVESRHDGLEIRHYAPGRIAETAIDGRWEDVLAPAFRRLAGFVFGGNARRERIAMTAPVTATRQTEGYLLAFAMPEGVDLPRPDDERIAIRAIPSRRVAVLRFRGRYDDDAIETKKRELMARVAKRGLVTRGESTFAGYDPPSTIPWLRRNEVWVEIEH
jgi:hypothetical protein